MSKLKLKEEQYTVARLKGKKERETKEEKSASVAGNSLCKDPEMGKHMEFNVDAAGNLRWAGKRRWGRLRK